VAYGAHQINNIGPKKLSRTVADLQWPTRPAGKNGQHAKYTTAELDRSCPVKKGAATRRRLGEQAAVNMHTMGTSFVAKVRDVRQIAHEQIGEGVAGMVEFKAQVNGYEATEKAKKSKSGAVFWTCSSPTDLTGIDLSHFFWALCGVGSTSQSSRVQDGDKSRAKEGAE